MLSSNENNGLSKIAHYRIVRKIGQGGMSIVYEAIDERLKRSVAIKMLHPIFAAKKDYQKRLIREAQSIARLSHPNIVQIFDVGNETDTSNCYIVSELLQGYDLSEFTKKFDVFEIPEISAMIIWQVALALEHAHINGIIHRDIKPQNIMITTLGQIKLMDFGIASLKNDDNLTHEGTLLGSLAHIAPEIIKGEKASISSDIFSLSTVFYWLVTSKHAFLKTGPHATIKAIIDEPFPKIQLCTPYVLDDLAKIIEQGLNKEPKNRFSSSLAMANAIEQSLNAMGIGIDIKKLAQTLSNPKELLPKFKEDVFKNIKDQILIYQEKKIEDLALTLMCRFQVPAKINKKVKNKFPKIFITAALCFFSISFISSFFIYKRNIKVKEIIPSKQKINTESLISENINIKNVEIAPKLPVKNEKLYDLNINIWPFANVILNGKLIARQVKLLKLKLKEGENNFLFIHPYAASLEKIINVEEKTNDYQIRLEKTKPAFLIIESNVDANILIDNEYKGMSHGSIAQPIVIKMPDKKYSSAKEIVLQKDGYEPLVIQKEFIAGETTRLKIDLKEKFNS